MKKFRFVFILLFASLATHCTGELPLSDLVNNTITLKLLGTFESNDPIADSAVTLQKDDIINSGITSSSPAWNSSTDIYTYANTLAASRLKYYIDIAEVRIARGQGKSSSQDIDDYWSQFAIDRQLLCSDYTSTGQSLKNCSEQNGVEKLYQFFNGGFTYPAVDIEAGTFNHLGIYFRRFNTAPAAIFNASGTFSDAAGNATTQTASEQAVTSVFDNRTIYGIDIESFLQSAYGETPTEPRMFPLQRKDLNIAVEKSYEPYVLEVRVFLKNLMMTHVRQLTIGSTTSGVVFAGPADWDVNYAFKDSDNGGKIGGSLLMTARTYQPGKVGSITMNATSSAGRYFAVQPAGTAYASPVKTLPLAATTATNTIIKNLQPGSYDVYLMCDNKRCTDASTAGSCDNLAGAGQDGFPETASLCTGGPYVVSSGTTTPVMTASCNTTCP